VAPPPPCAVCEPWTRAGTFMLTFSLSLALTLTSPTLTASCAMSSVCTRKLLFSTRSYAAMASELLPLGPFELGSLERKDFPDGEHYMRITSPVMGRDVVLLGGTVNETDTLEIYDLASGLVDGGCHRLWIVVPYFGYSTMERAVKAGEVVTAKTRARMLSSIPLPGSGAQVVLLDLHVDSIAWYFEGHVRPTHLQGRPLLLEIIRSVAAGGGGGSVQPSGEAAQGGGGGAPPPDFVLASTDAGRAKIVESLANDLRAPASFVFKRRLDSGGTEVTAVSAGVAGKHVIIYDDMIRTGGSLVGAAQAYKASGASRVSVVATHGVFAPGALEKLRASGIIDAVATTDSHPRAREQACDFLTVHSVAPLLAAYLASQTL
jgi:ribose-phosphate pyrophosphokinase